MTNTSRLWKVLAALLVVSFPASSCTSGTRSTSRHRHPHGRGHDHRPDPLQRRAVARASRCGTPSAASSSAGSGAMAVMSPRTGRPTGCIAKRWRCGKYGRQRAIGMAFQQLGASRQAELNAGSGPRCGATPTTADRHDYADGRACRGGSASHAALRRPVRRRSVAGQMREQYAMNSGSLPNTADLQALPAFFFWAAWSAATDRPGERDLSYTSNWPHEPLVGNSPTAGTGIWSIASVILLIAAIAGMIFYRRSARKKATPPRPKSIPCSI